jgi:hypothetical protein
VASTTGVDRAPGGRPVPRLDGRTLLVPGPDEGWHVTLYEDAAEATIYRPPVPPADEDEVRDGGAAAPFPPERTEDEARIAQGECRERTVRRAKGRARRYATANRATHLWTFTYRPDPDGHRPQLDRPADRRRVKLDWARFARILPPGTAWLRTLEGHKDGSIHVHAAMTYGRGDERRTRALAALWGHGFVDEAKVRPTRPGQRERARAVARYVVKYAVKAIEAGDLEPGEHAYEVAQGFGPVAVRLRAWTRAEARREAIGTMGGEVPAYEWESDECATWTGPPVTFLAW